MSRLADITADVRERIPEGVRDAWEDVDITVLLVEPARLVDVLGHLRDRHGFDMLTDLSGTDWLPRDPRYDVNYHLLSLEHDDRLRVKVQLPDTDEPRLPSACDVWPTANWHEREVYDFFGIVFDGHPDLRRLLMPDEWVGHPLRKDYAVGGVPVEYKIEPAYMGDRVVSAESRPSAGGIPARLDRDRGKPSHWTWTGIPASEVEIRRSRRPQDPGTTHAEVAEPEAPQAPEEPPTEREDRPGDRQP